METLTFKKEVDGKWYLWLPKYQGDRSDLEMVAGTEIILHMILENTRLYASQQSVVIQCSLDEHELESNMVFHFDTEDENGGGWYRVYHNIPTILSTPFSFKVWICDVIKVVFGHIPKVIYCKV